MRAVVLGVVVLAVLVVMSVVRASYDVQTPEQRRCQQLQIAANSVPEREDTVADEVEYVRLSEQAEKACG